MKLLLAPDSFKGSLDAAEVAALLEAQARIVFPDCVCVSLPLADGGEGTMDVLLAALGGRSVCVDVAGPRFAPVEARYAILEGGTAVIEMAQASGLPLLPPDQRDPTQTTTFGTGQLIAHALDAGLRRFILGVGGSATNDGGIGAMAALGVRFLDVAGNAVEAVGASLGRIARIDTSGLHPAIRESTFTVICDIDNPLCGERGATYVYGPQKGGRPEQLDALERGMQHYAELLQTMSGIDLQTVPGSGAAGGLSAAYRVFLDGKLQSGIQTVLDICDFDARLEGVDLVVTGEGRADAQSACGKVLYGVGMACKRLGIPAVAVVGGMGAGAEALYDCGISSILPAINGVMTIENAMANAAALVSDAAYRLFRLIALGQSMTTPS